MASKRSADPVDLGLHFLIGLEPAVDLSDHDRKLLERLRPAGVVLYRGNFLHGVSYEQWTAKLARLLRDVRRWIGRERIFVCIDHEGGTVHRPPPPITHYSFAREWRERSGPVGHAMGIELRSLGVNVGFAPVLDIHSNPSNPVIGPRAFGETAEEVSVAARAFLRGLQSEGVIGSPKHFPGHGEAAVDSHHELPVLDLTPDTLRNREIVPYRELLSDVRLIMTAHILFPRLDSQPATLSRAIVNGLLREEMGYTGVVVTDDIGMHAVSNLFESPEAAPQAIRAGCDLLMVCDYWTDTTRALAFAENIRDALRRGTLDDRTLESSRRRVEALLQETPQHSVEVLPREVLLRHAALAPRCADSPGSRGGQTVSIQDD